MSANFDRRHSVWIQRFLGAAHGIDVKPVDKENISCHSASVMCESYTLEFLLRQFTLPASFESMVSLLCCWKRLIFFVLFLPVVRVTLDSSRFWQTLDSTSWLRVDAIVVFMQKLFRQLRQTTKAIVLKVINQTKYPSSAATQLINFIMRS